MTRTLRLMLAGAFAALSAFRAGATTIVLPDDAQLVEKSPVVVVATVERTAPIVRSGGVWTETTLRTENVLKGTAPSTLTVREVGGRVGDAITVIFGAPVYTAGERVLVFLTPTPRGDFQTTDLLVGKFTERMTRDGERIWYRDDAVNGTQLLDRNFRPLATTNAQRDAEKFERFVRDSAAGRDATRDYLVGDPQFNRAIESNFTLISEPTIYRWGVFDSAASVSWRSVGSQVGYNNGGVSELQTAMAAWTGYANANIRYTYGGNVATTTGGLNTPNGSNEVIFNDPRGEIAGTWDPSSGGVVGIGGFNNVSSAGSWTAPFTADADHPAGLIANTFNITEGNLVIQDGVSPARGVSSLALAEIIAHELGHTLGLGHSADKTALMYFQVTGGGPSLRADDQVAARWLYPGSGGGTTAIPPAPSGLTAQASGTSVALQWGDNAADETRQTVYIAQATSGFVRLTDVAANATTLNVTGLTKGQSYSFRVTASNTVGESPASNVASVTIQSDLLQASFRVSPINGVAAKTLFTCTDRSTGPASRWLWDFGDGATATTQNPTHTYATPGTYAITLTVYSTAPQQSSTSHNVVVTSADAEVAAAFSFSPNDPTIIDTIEFNDESTGAVSAWSWNFGDGTGSTEQNPQHQYAAGGSYNVTLTATGNGRSSDATKVVKVGSGSGGTSSVDADFSTATSTPATGDSIQFRDVSTGQPNSWYWQFGDGAISTQQHPTHVYKQQGTFAVTLTAGNLTSSSSRTHSLVIVTPQQRFRALVPVAAQTEGSGGFQWRTELTLFNSEQRSVAVTFRYIPSSGAEARQKALTVAPVATLRVGSALEDLFGVSSGAGAILIEAVDAPNAPRLSVASRTFTNSSAGTYGQYVADVADARSAATTYITGIASSGAFRTNLGLVNLSAAPATVALTLFADSGAPLAAATVNVAGGSFQQSALSAIFPTLSGEHDTLSLRIVAPSPDTLFGYASVVDNRTQDPVYIGATARPSETSTMIPAIARAPGAAGTFWRSDVVMLNPSLTEQTYELTFLRAGAANAAAPVARRVTLGAGATTRIADVTTALGAGDASGSLLVRWSSAAGAPIISSRTYTDRSSDGGTYGQSIDATSSFASDVIVTGLQSSREYRTNLGFVNGSAQSLTVNVTLVDATGAVLKEATLTLPPLAASQVNVVPLFGLSDGNIGAFTIRAHASAPSLFAYGSVIDNASGDPIFIAGR